MSYCQECANREAEIQRLEGRWNGAIDRCDSANDKRNDLMDDVQRLRAKVAALEAENDRLKAPVTDEDYTCMFLAMSAVNREPGKPMRGMEVFNAIIAARAKEQP